MPVGALRRAAALLLLVVVAAAARAEPLVIGVDAVAMPVAEMERSLRFYTEMLPFERESEAMLAGEPWERLHGVPGLRTRVVRLRLGDERLELMEALGPPGRPIPADSRSNDRWFQHVAIIVSDMERAYRHLEAHHVAHVSPAPQRLPDSNPNAGGIRAFYFKDPDGHPLEILSFPPGKGDPRWQRDGGRLFLGIDHTAIVVADTDASLGFYRDLLGLRVAGESDNFGPEQERLNAVSGAHLHITALRAGAGPGIELLEYLTPRDGRPYPADARANDLLQWQTRLVTGRGDPGAQLRQRVALVSPHTVKLAGSGLDFTRAVIARDPDGHAMELVRH